MASIPPQGVGCTDRFALNEKRHKHRGREKRLAGTIDSDPRVALMIRKPQCNYQVYPVNSQGRPAEIAVALERVKINDNLPLFKKKLRRGGERGYNT